MERRANYDHPEKTLHRYSASQPLIVSVSARESVLFPQTDEQRRQKIALFEGLRRAGFAVLSPIHVLAAACYVIDQTGISMPYEEVTDLKGVSKKQMKEVISSQQRFVAQTLSNLSLNVEGGRVRYLYGEEDITSAVEESAERNVNNRLRSDLGSPAWVNGMRGMLKGVAATAADSADPIAYVDVGNYQITDDKMTPSITVVTDECEKVSQKSDVSVNVISSETVRRRVSEVSSNFATMRERRQQLKESISNGELTFVPQFDRRQWPSHPLMTHLKQQSVPVVAEVMLEKGVTADPLDLLYQSLFRATTYSIAEVFENGEQLEEQLRGHGVYDDWRNIMTLDPRALSYPVNAKVLKQIVNEQMVTVAKRAQNTNLPVSDIIGRQGIFGEIGWQLHKVGGEVLAIKAEGDRLGEDAAVEQKVFFAPVDTELAKEFHRVFHYIHTPRAEKAFGLFLEGEELPFSVVAFDKIDREYKKDLLLMMGYDPSKCLDLARLYSRPGTPFNTSSTIFTLAFDYFRANEQDIQATLSAFMPTYAHGMSMISAGFNDGVLIKPGGHTFGKTVVDGQETWEHLTKRRTNESQESVQSQWPLLPVMELLAPIQPKPRFTPFPEMKDKMLVINH